MLFLQRLYDFDANRMNIEELVELLTFAKLYVSEFQNLDMDEPEKVTDQIRALKREIGIKREDYLLMRKKQLLAQKDGLKTPAERKQSIEKELAKINKQLQPA